MQEVSQIRRRVSSTCYWRYTDISITQLKLLAFALQTASRASAISRDRCCGTLSTTHPNSFPGCAILMIRFAVLLITANHVAVTEFFRRLTGNPLAA